MSTPPNRPTIGVVTSGSLVEGLTARLDPVHSVEEMRVGKFLVIHGTQHEFFCMLTDVMLEATSPNILTDPPDADPFLREVLHGTSTYGSITLSPRLMLPTDMSGDLSPVKTIPSHFSPVFEATEADFQRVFGQQSATMFEIGQPLDMDVPITLNLERFVERSNGVFGKSGTGKSFLTRLLLCGTIVTKTASNLIFDMHSEYGWETPAEDRHKVKGLRQLFGSKVLVYSLDPASTRRRGSPLDAELVIGLDQIEPDDVLLLQQELNLTNTAAESSFLLADHFKQNWMKELLDMDGNDIKEFAERAGAHPGSLTTLKRKLLQIQRRKFTRPTTSTAPLECMIDALANGYHVVLEFGQYHQVLDYMLVANIITRRIHSRWVAQTEKFSNTGKEGDRPQQLMITIEEAHKFLNPQSARQTIFGKIAREMRKYSVTLLVVDQRPSSIDHEVMSQIGTRITALLNDDKDIDAVFSGVSGSQGLKAVLASLDSKQQAMVLGHAVPMAVIMRTRPYDEAFYAAVGYAQQDEPEGSPEAYAHAKSGADELFAS